MVLDSQDTIVFSDQHASVKALELIEDVYPGVRKIDAGDRVDGANTSRYLQVAGELGVLSTIGNHEWVLAAILQEEDEFVRDLFFHKWRAGRTSFRAQYEKGLLASYGVDESWSNRRAAEKLYGIMWRSGHLDLLNRSEVYYESPEFIVVHAGLLDEDWESQKLQLDEAKRHFDLFDYADEPAQVFDIGSHQLSSSPDQFCATDKVVITGHHHFTAGPEERSTADGQRIRIASKLAIGEPVFVWQSWDGQVVELR